jgi:hypothetical protein
MVKTSERLAERLEKVGLLELAVRARKGDFSDYESTSATPKLDLIRELWKYPFPEARAIRQQVIDGEFDETREESEEWAKTPEAQEIFRRLFGGKQ